MCMHNLYRTLAHWFPIPKIIDMKYAGVHITSNNKIIYLECDHKGDFLIPTKAEIVTFKRENDDDVSDLVQKLSELKKKYNTEFVKVSIPESKSYLFEVEIPKVEGADIRDAVAFTIEEKAPVSLSEIVFGYKITDDFDPEIYKVAVGVVPLPIINSYIETFNSAGFIPITFKVEAQAVVNAVVEKGNTENVMVVSIKENKTVITLVQNGGVFLSTTVDTGGAAFDAVLKREFPDANEKELKDIKYHTNFISENTNPKIQADFLEISSLIKNNLNKYYIYWLTHKANTNSSHKELDKIIVVGDESCIPGFIDYLKSNLKVLVEEGNVWVNCFSLTDHVPIIHKIDSFDYAECVGLLVGQE